MYEVKVTKLENEGSNVIGLASLVVDGQMKFNNIRLVKNDSEKGFFVSMPSYKKSEGEYENYFHPITREMVDKMTDAAAKSLESGEAESFYTTFQTEVFRVAVGFDGKSVKMQISNDFVCNSMQIREDGRDNGKTLFVAMPSYKKKDGTYENVCYPVTKDFRDMLYGKILDERKHVKTEGFVKAPMPELEKNPEETKAASKETDAKATPEKENPKKPQSRKGRSR